MKSEELLKEIIRAIVNNPDDVLVKKEVDNLGVLMTVKVNKKDAGLVVGKKGKTIKTIREIMFLVGAREKSRINIKLDIPTKRAGDKINLLIEELI